MENTKVKNISFSAPESTAGNKSTDRNDTSADDASSRSWPEFLTAATDEDIAKRFSRELFSCLSSHTEVLKKYCCLTLIASHYDDSIGDFYADRIHAALAKNLANRDKDILLILVSGGGSIEPAYQISKLCRSFAKDKFVVALPRRAKSAATLLSLGADKIYMGQLGQLGPIDPQLRGLPAIGVVPALRRIATLSQEFPGSAEMFARYLRASLTVEQIGYCERIAESAAQYAQRLLLTKNFTAEKANEIALRLVYEFKDHGFVIDYDEATNILGAEWIGNSGPELNLAEQLYSLIEPINLFMDFVTYKRLVLIGEINERPLIFQRRRS